MKKHTVNMTQGSILSQIIAFAIPIMIAGVLQTLYNAADMIVVGKFAGKVSLAAVGSTSSAVNLLINIFLGLSSATNVIVARKFGAKNENGVSKTVHTAITVSVIGGIFVSIIGILTAKQILLWMSSPEDVIELATLYMRIYFIGVPATLLYNFGSAVLRAVGDAKRPTYFLMLSGIINVLLNLLFVIVFKMGVSGVAVATVISQVFAAALVVMCLRKTDDCCKFSIRKARVHGDELKEMLFLGIPAGIQSSIFSISNIIIQSSINSCGSDVMAGNSAAASIEGIVYIAMNAFFHTTITFVGQNYGAHNFRRMRRGFWTAMVLVAVFGAMLSFGVYAMSEFLLSFYTDSNSVVEIGKQRLGIVCTMQFLCGFMEIGTGGLRGMGVAVRSMITCLVGVCGIRIFMTAVGAPYKVANDLVILYYSYPISWVITTVILVIFFMAISFSREKEWEEHKVKKALEN